MGVAAAEVGKALLTLGAAGCLLLQLDDTDYLEAIILLG